MRTPCAPAPAVASRLSSALHAFTKCCAQQSRGAPSGSPLAGGLLTLPSPSPLACVPVDLTSTAFDLPPRAPPPPPPRSKFVSGVLGSRTSPSMLLAGGLIATAALNVAFGFSTSLVWFCTWWALNGMLQVRRRGAGRRC